MQADISEITRQLFELRAAVEKLKEQYADDPQKAEDVEGVDFSLGQAISIIEGLSTGQDAADIEESGGDVLPKKG